MSCRFSLLHLPPTQIFIHHWELLPTQIRMATLRQNEALIDEIGSLHVLTLNCWGLKYLSKHRRERLSEIGNRLAAYQPALDIVGLQECWTFSDYTAIRNATRQCLPYGKFYHSGKSIGRRSAPFNEITRYFFGHVI